MLNIFFKVKLCIRWPILSAWHKLIHSSISVSTSSVMYLWVAFTWKLSNSAVWFYFYCLYKHITANKYFSTLNRQSYKFCWFLILAVIWDGFNITLERSLISYCNHNQYLKNFARRQNNHPALSPKITASWEYSDLRNPQSGYDWSITC